MVLLVTVSSGWCNLLVLLVLLCGVWVWVLVVVAS